MISVGGISIVEKVMNKGLQKRVLSKKANSNADLDHEIDNTLTLTENKTQLKVKGIIKKKSESMPVEQYQDYLDEEIKKFNSKQKVDINPQIEHYYRPIKMGIEKIKNGFENLVLCKSRAGLGKTYWIKNYLIEMGLYKNVDVAVDCSEAYFIEMLWNNRNGGIVWVKDIVRLLKNQVCLDNLKSATEDNAEDRVITNYNYSRQKKHIDKKFIFNGSFIFDYNELYDLRFKADFEALRSRGTFVELVFSKEQIDDIMKKICKNDWQKEVTKFLIKHYTFVGTNNYNLRTQHNAFQTYLNSTKMKRDWSKDLFYELKYNMSPIKAMLYAKMGKNIVTTTELKRWLVRSGRINSLRTADRRILEYIEIGELFKVTESKYKTGLSLFPMEKL